MNGCLLCHEHVNIMEVQLMSLGKTQTFQRLGRTVPDASSRNSRSSSGCAGPPYSWWGNCGSGSRHLIAPALRRHRQGKAGTPTKTTPAKMQKGEEQRTKHQRGRWNVGHTDERVRQENWPGGAEQTRGSGWSRVEEQERFARQGLGYMGMGQNNPEGEWEKEQGRKSRQHAQGSKAWGGKVRACLPRLD